MIISASRRTDIPAFFSDWFFERIKEGKTEVENPFNGSKREVSLLPQDVDGIVFWTKNPKPMLDRLNLIKDYPYYFQFTITAASTDIEPNLDKTEIVDTFKRLSDLTSPDRVIWRFDPIFFTNIKNEQAMYPYTPYYVSTVFESIAKRLKGYTKRVIISTIKTNYKTVKKNANKLRLVELNPEKHRAFYHLLANIAQTHNMDIFTCAEQGDYSEFGIQHSHCIDGDLMAKIAGKDIQVEKAKGQRAACGCAASIDIGWYNTCKHGCLYCYACY